MYFYGDQDIRFGNNQEWSIEYYNGGFNFWKPNISGGDYKLFIKDNGNVGIGTNLCGRKLDLRGDMRWDDPNDSNNNDVVFDWSDYGKAVLWSTRNYQMNLGKSAYRMNHIFTNKMFYTTGVYKSSDKRMKEDIQQVKSVMPKLKQIKSYNYRFKEEYFKDAPLAVKERLNQQKEYGFLAQEIQAVFPSLVHQPDSGMMSVDYVGMIPLLLEAIKEQDAKIVELEADKISSAILLNEIEELKKEVEKLSNQNYNNGKMKSGYNYSGAEETVSSYDLTLFQNTPNPFNEITTIKMTLPEDAKNAEIAIYDLTGKQEIAVTVSERGEASVQINGEELKPGMYLYSLIVDGKLIDTKTMIVTE